jgi:hypothetical protein
VELNAFASDALVAWIEAKLAERKITKVIPTGRDLAAAFRRALQPDLIRAQIHAVEAQAAEAAAAATTPKTLAADIRARLEAERTLPWDAALAEIAAQAVAEGEVTLPEDA